MTKFHSSFPLQLSPPDHWTPMGGTFVTSPASFRSFYTPSPSLLGGVIPPCTLFASMLQLILIHRHLKQFPSCRSWFVIRNQYFEDVSLHGLLSFQKSKYFCELSAIAKYSMHELTGNCNQIVKQLLWLWQSEDARLHVSACEDNGCAANSRLKAW